MDGRSVGGLAGLCSRWLSVLLTCEAVGLLKKGDGGGGGLVGWCVGYIFSSLAGLLLGWLVSRLVYLVAIVGVQFSGSLLLAGWAVE